MSYPTSVRFCMNIIFIFMHAYFYCTIFILIALFLCVGPPTELKLRAGDVVMAHVLLAHKGGRNVAGGNLSTNSTERSDIDKYIDNIPRGSREMVFFRVRKKGLNYVDPARSARVLNEPWCEFGPLVERLRRVSLLNTY